MKSLDDAFETMDSITGGFIRRRLFGNGTFLLNLVLTSLLTLCLAFALKPIFSTLFDNWSSADNNYCYFIIPLFIYLCWNLRSGFQFHAFTWSPWGLLPVLFGVGLVFTGVLSSTVTFLYLGVWVWIIGALLLFYGRRIRQLAFPVMMLFFITPLPDLVNQVLTVEFKTAAGSLAAILLELSGVNVLRQGSIFNLGVSDLQISGACSGLRYLMPLLILTLLTGYYFSRGLWRRIVLIFLLIPLVIALNAVRIWITGIICVTGHLNLARSFFHSFSGTIVFIIACGIVFGTCILLNRMGPSRVDKRRITPNDASVSCDPSRAITLTIMLCYILIVTGYGLHSTPRRHRLTPGKSFRSFPMEIGRWQGNRSRLIETALFSIGADDGVLATYHRVQTQNAVNLLIAFYDYQAIYRTAHTPQSCQLYAGWTVTESIEKSISVGSRKMIPILIQYLEKKDTKLLTAYFYYQRGRVFISPWLNKFYLFWDSITKRRTDGALVRVQMMLNPGQDSKDAYLLLEAFIIGLWKALQNHVPV